MKNGQVIISIADKEMAAIERELIAHPCVAGVIMLEHNFHSANQIASLIREIKKIKPQAIVASDHEGGRVQLLQFGFTKVPAMREWGKYYQEEPLLAKKKLADLIAVVSKELKSVGVNLNFAPVLDVDRGHSQVIGERSFGNCPDLVTALAHVVIDQMRAHGMPSIGKHFPGHGAVVADSHTELPVDHRTWQEVWQLDVKPFVALAHKLDAVMAAHILYPNVDTHPTSFSKRWLRGLLREHMGYQGIVISDDLNMSAAAVAGGFAERAMLALEAGCDLLIACHNQQGMIDVVEALENWQDQSSQARLAHFISQLQ